MGHSKNTQRRQTQVVKRWKDFEYHAATTQRSGGFHSKRRPENA